MKTITKEYQIYTFDELSQEAKDKALNDYFAEESFDFLSEDMEYKLTELLAENQIKISDGDKLKIQYSLSNCQGDGAMFEGRYEWNGYEVSIKQSGHYYHFNSKQIEMWQEKHDTCETVDASEEVYKQFDNLYVSICKELARYGYDVIETYQSEESFKDICEENGYTFLSTGEMFNE